MTSILRYVVKQDHHGTWSVLDAVTGEQTKLHGVLLVSLREELARDVTDLLNLEQGKIGDNGDSKTPL